MQLNDGTFRLLADNIPTLCWMANPDGYIIWYNRRWYEYTGSTPEQMEGWGWQSVHDPMELPAVLERWRLSIATGQPFNMVFPLKAANGHYSPFLTRVAPTLDRYGAVTGWFGTNTDISDQVKAEEARALVTSELSHRIKNIFTVVGGLVAISAKNFPEAKGFVTDLKQRINALSYAHNFIHRRAEGEPQRASTLFGMIHDLLAPYHDGARYVTRGDDFEISENAATPLALLFHELATNAAKYGAFSTHSGKVTVTIVRSVDDIRIDWDEEHGPSVTEPQRYGFGSRLALISVEEQLGGSLLYEWKPSGLTVKAMVPAISVLKPSAVE